jgi:hypothetical protein
VFATPSGKRLGSVKKSLSELLKVAGLLTDHRGARRTAYSFRHFHISQQLIAGVDVFLLAKNTGTSSDPGFPVWPAICWREAARFGLISGSLRHLRWRLHGTPGG